MDHSQQRALEDQLALEYVQAERLRATLMAGGFSIGFLLTLVVYLFLSSGAPRLQSGAFLPISPIISLSSGLAAVYCWLSLLYVNRKIATKQGLPRLFLIVNSVVEVSGISLVLFLISRVSNPAFALSAPPVLLYLVVIMVSILRLDARVSVFVALIAAIQYVALARILLQTTSSGAPSLFLSPFPIYLRSGILAISGLGAARISHDLRRRVIRAAEVVVERDRTMAMFGQHVSPQVAERLLQEQAGQVTELRPVCVLFLDIRDFTRFSESRPPSEVVAFLNTLFAPLVAIVDRHGGIINKFLGDGFLAIFGAPLPSENHCLSAVRAALDLIEAVQKLTRSGQLPPTRIGIGLHAGDVITGSVGSSLRREYTVIGDTVNLASRIEQLTKVHAAQILASDAVIAQLPPGECATEKLPPATVKGREAPVQLYKLA
jgi:adenylate cyclase